tara:strand:+ start:1086 stop:1289 length:204 start_codon:yes stop_codon:yes gene_type:complete
MFGRFGDATILVVIGLFCLTVATSLTDTGMVYIPATFTALGVIAFALCADFTLDNPLLRWLARRTSK